MISQPPEKDRPLTLLDLKEGDTASILRITGGRHLKARMAGLGIREGTLVRLISAAPFRGPLLVEDVSSGARTMIGRGMAASVEVCDHAPS
ncbi:MAG TPA: FeoA family protein [Deltaproteobacteria bacterium]|nr:FeoA family protein [Deltaproteobacteria bacterium]HXK46656.1 FeoA family protein [Deltaproteobacteria bacterium]